MTAPETILALAREQGTPPSHLAKWKLRKYVPHPYRHALIMFAAQKGTTLTTSDLDWRDSPASEAGASASHVAA